MRLTLKFTQFKFILLIFFVFFIVVIVSTNSAVANPENDPDDFDDCHKKGDYSISSETNETLEVEKGSKFLIDIKGSGPDVVLKFNPVCVDNDRFECDPAEIVEDNSEYDEDNDLSNIFVNFTLTAPNEEGTYRIMFYVRGSKVDPGTGRPYIDFIVFEITVEKPSSVPLWKTILDAVFNHSNIYLGIPAVSCLAIGLVLYEKDFRKYSRTHGVLSNISLILTTVSTIFVIPQTLTFFASLSNPLTIDWLHLIHITLGIVGYGACIVAGLSGISGIDHKNYGYIALACWGFNLIFGMIYWGIGLGA